MSTNKKTSESVARMSPGDRYFIHEERVVCVEASQSSDDFKDKSLRYITLAESSENLHPNDVAARIVKVAS